MKTNLTLTITGITMLAAGMTAGALSAQPADFDGRRYPAAPGDRQAEVVVKLNGIPRSRVQVWMEYSDTLDGLNAPNAPTGRASCRSIEFDSLKCSFIFPHSAHPKPNILAQSELNGGEPPHDRPTLADAQASPANFSVTDVSPKRIGAPNRVRYRWVKVVTGSGGQTIRDTVHSFLMARFFIIANVGDSYAAGEGAPNRNLVRTFQTLDGALDNGQANDFASEPMWSNTPCHNSDESGQSRGINQLAAENPGLAIRAINVACSGAGITFGLVNSQTIQPDLIMDPQSRRVNTVTTKKTQIQQLKEWLEANNRSTIDVMLLSITGNDMGFGTVASKCLVNLGECHSDNSVTTMIGNNLPLINGLLTSLKSEFDTQSFDVKYVVQFGYPDPTRDANGAFCRPASQGSCWGLVEQSVSQADFRFIHDSFLAPMNTAIKAFADNTRNWEFVDLTGVSRNHGICNCAGGFFNTMGQSSDKQGDLFGSVHPNRTGYREMYQPKTVERVIRRFAIGRAIEFSHQQVAGN